MTDFANLVLKVDSSAVKPAVNELDRLAAAGTRAEGATDRLGVTARTTSNALTRVGVSAGQQRAGMQQLSFQIGDVAQQFALGQRPMMIFAQQSGQVIQAITMMRGSAGGLIGFLAGPWGAVLTGAAVILGSLAAAHSGAADAADGQTDAAEELLKATNDLHEATLRSTRSTERAIQVDIDRANSLRQRANEARGAAIAELELAKARQRAAGESLDSARSSQEIGGGAVLAITAARDIEFYDAEIARQQAIINQNNETIRLNRGRIIQGRIEEEFDAGAAAAGKYERRLDQLNAQLQSGAIGEREYAGAIREATRTREAEEEAAREADRSGRTRTRTRRQGLTEEQRELRRASEAADSYIERLRQEIEEIGKTPAQLRALEVARAREAAVTEAQRTAIDQLNGSRERELALEEARKASRDAAEYARDVIAPLEREAQVLGLVGAAREMAMLALEQEAELAPLLARIRQAEIEGNTALADALREQVRLIERKYQLQGQAVTFTDTLQREAEAAEMLARELDRVIGAVGSLGGVGSVIGTLLGVSSGNIGSIGGPVGAILQTQTGTMLDREGRTVARTLGDELREIFQLNGEFGKTMTTLLQGAGTGVLTGSAIFGEQNTIEQLGAGIGGALGQVGGEALGKALGSSLGALGQAAGPLGSIIGSVVGSLLGSALSKTPRGSATIGGVGGELGVTGTRGNSNARIAAASKSAGGIIDSLSALAEELGATIDPSRGSVSIGIRDGNFRVDTSGQGRTKTKKGAIDFGEDAEAAALFAIQDLIRDGVLVGLRAGTEALLKGARDVETGVAKALKFESVFKELASLKNPLQFALDELTREFDRLRAIFAEAGASAEEYAQLEELLALKRQDAIDTAARRLVDEQSDRVDLEVRILQLLGREQEALSKAREQELAATKAALQPLQSMIFQLEDARDIIERFSPLAADLKAFRAELLGGGATGGGFDFLRSQFRSTATAAAGGDADALGKLRGTASAFLDAARDNASSALDYQRAVGEVLASVDKGIFAADSQIEYAQLQIDAVKQLYDATREMRTEMRTTQQQIVENTSQLTRLWQRFEGDGLRVKTDSDTPLQVEVV